MRNEWVNGAGVMSCLDGTVWRSAKEDSKRAQHARIQKEVATYEALNADAPVTVTYLPKEPST